MEEGILEGWIEKEGEELCESWLYLYYPSICFEMLNETMTILKVSLYLADIWSVLQDKTYHNDMWWLS
jgi:hypothetical protein